MSSAPAERSIWWISARSGVTAALSGLAAALVAAVLCWLPDAGVSGRPTSAIKAGMLAFLDAHLGGMTLNQVSIAFTPLAMTGVVGFIAWRAGRTLAEATKDFTEPAELCAALGTQTAGYVVCCGLLVPFSRLGTSHVSLLPTLFAAAVLFALVSGAALAKDSPLGDEIILHIPLPLWRGLRGASATVAVYLAAGSLLALGSIVWHAGRVMDLSRQVGGGLSGFPVLVLGVVCVPNASIAGAAYLAGPGFAVGDGTSVSAFSTSHGVLPAFPILGAVPEGHGADTAVLALMAITTAGAGLAAAAMVRREGARSLRDWSEGVAATAGCTALAMALLAWLGGGSAGPGRLQVVGASPWRLALTSAVVVAFVGELIVLGWWGWQRLGRGAGDEAAVPEQELATSQS